MYRGFRKLSLESSYPIRMFYIKLYNKLINREILIYYYNFEIYKNANIP